MRYYYDLNECGRTTEDFEGIDRADLAEVRAEALRAARAVMCAEVVEGRLCLSCHIAVRNEAGEIVLTIPFRDAITITGT